MAKGSLTYADAGVDIARSDAAKKRIAALARRTFTRGVLTEVGGFGALFSLGSRQWKSPVLVSSTDGVGTKLKIAFATGGHRKVAADLVNHCVNDIAVQGAAPLFFLDYFACADLDSTVLEEVIAGLSTACRAHGCALIGGETAQLPGFYAKGEYDLAGFIVGAVERKSLIDGKRITSGDVLIGLPSAGLHTNGYSLARKLLLDEAGYRLDERVPRLGCSVAEELLKPHRSYYKAIAALHAAGILKGAAHITGGGIPGNVPRILPQGLEARLERGSWPEPPLFTLLREIGNVPDEEMWRTFNMGLGMVLVVARRDLATAEELLRKAREKYFIAGSIQPGRRGAVIERARGGTAL